MPLHRASPQVHLLPLRSTPQFVLVPSLGKSSASCFCICSWLCVCLSFQLSSVSFSNYGSQSVWCHYSGSLSQLPLTSFTSGPIWTHSAEFSFAAVNSKIQSLRMRRESHLPLTCLGDDLKWRPWPSSQTYWKPSVWGKGPEIVF